ncbi:MAG: Hsp20/alpha crystallin family protein [Kiritimatiellae bacterium]|nr:Hsp20/alpha crystallin family protein [Kiritimatiellia bacterium]
METNIPNYEPEPKRESRINWFLITVIILLCIVSFVQGVILFNMKNERDGLSIGRILRECFQKACPGQLGKVRQANVSPQDNQVVFWETTDDLDQIHDQINRLLRNMTTTFGSPMASGPFPGITIQHKDAHRSPAMPPSSRDLNELQREIERIFEDAYNENQQSSLLSRVNHGWDMVPSAAAMNIEDRGSNYVVAVAMPGFEKEAITISLEGRLLIIDAEQPARAQAAATRNVPAAHQGRLHTQIMMPDNIEGIGTQAVFDHDVLRVHIPKAVETNSLVRAIAIR